MGKRLSEMSLEELWQLFPIYLTAHQPCWKEWYWEEAARLKETLPEDTIISHIGSTAIPTIWAKPIIDILVEIPEGSSMSVWKERISDCGWLCMAEKPERMSFNKGYTENGFAERVFHLHLRYAGDNAEIDFRDYLLAHADAAREYEKLKLELWHRFEHDRDGYTNAKADLVRRITEEAQIWKRKA